jgi:hypothetical protein
MILLVCAGQGNALSDAVSFCSIRPQRGSKRHHATIFTNAEHRKMRADRICDVARGKMRVMLFGKSFHWATKASASAIRT